MDGYLELIFFRIHVTNAEISLGGCRVSVIEPTGTLWIRALSFSRLHSIVGLLRTLYPSFTAREFDDLVSFHEAQIDPGGRRISRTTLYYYRATLKELGILNRSGTRYWMNTGDKCVMSLVDSAPYGFETRDLSRQGREAFAELVLRNPDCRALFFDLFMAPKQEYGLRDFEQVGKPVSWGWDRTNSHRQVYLEGESGLRLRLRHPNHIKAIVYGIRYWARDELFLVDEFFREDKGLVLFPVARTNDSVQDVVQEILRYHNRSSEWTTLSLRDLALWCCQERRRPLSMLISAVKALTSLYPGRVVLIPTSRSLATITAASRQREELELRGYFRDGRGRYISHIRIHSSI